MVCSNCGATLREDSAFCSKCGSALQSKIFCAKCGTELEAGDGFCFACGAPVKKASENPVSSKSAAITDPSTPKSPSVKKISSKKVNRPGVDTCVYSEWNTFQNWKNNYCVAAGCDGYHFIRGHIGFWGESEKRIIRVEEKGINGIAFELPFEVKYLFGEGGRLWMTEKNYDEPDVNPVYRIWSMDPETLEYKIEYDLSEFASKYYFNKPFITTSSIYIPANKEMDHDELLCLDRVTNKIRPIFVSGEKNDTPYRFGNKISSISNNAVLIQDDYGDHEIHDRVVVDNTGKKVLLREYPGIKEMIPILLKLSNRSLPHREDYDPDIYDDPDKEYKKDYLDCINSVLENIIYIDFSDQNIYFCPDSWSSNESFKHKQYCIPFGATSVDEAVAYWEEPNDFSLAGESRSGSGNVELDTHILFDGKNAVGCSTAGTHRPWCLQTAKGKMINFNQNGQSKLDEVSTYAALIGDWLYLFDAEYDRLYYAKFHLGDSVPVEQKIEIIEK